MQADMGHGEGHQYWLVSTNESIGDGPKTAAEGDRGALGGTCLPDGGVDGRQ